MECKHPGAAGEARLPEEEQERWIVLLQRNEDPTLQDQGEWCLHGNTGVNQSPGSSLLEERRSLMDVDSLAEKGTGIDQQKKKPKPRGVKPTLPSQYHLKFVYAGEPSPPPPPPPPPGTSPLSSFSRKNKRHKRAHNCNNTMMKRAGRTMEGLGKGLERGLERDSRSDLKGTRERLQRGLERLERDLRGTWKGTREGTREGT
ncbi:hypothetical protein F7725_017106 [Dissostichus mawsoni]|uniref:Uncharacterized protein n=1 Tax=Dissostichus mawsoni TaxID=36200 RepID=A0A7J5Z4G0_DISMA|nr:hypothetical protein F7725_017106 [Dissostichus mawsoni]